MLKKLISTSLLALGFLLVPSTHAIWFDAAGLNLLDWNLEDYPLLPLYIDATEDGEITVQNDLIIRLPQGLAIQWSRKQASINFQGSAAGKVSPTVIVSDDLRALTIDVTENFVKNDRLEVHNATVLTFSANTSANSLQLDYDADEENDVANSKYFKVDEEHSDYIKPYPPENLVASYNYTKNEVSLSWMNPKNYDFLQVVLRRERDRDGAVSKKDVYAGPGMSHTDRSVNTAIDFKLGDTVTYYLLAQDTNGNSTDELSITLELQEPAPDEPIEEEPVEEPIEEDPADDEPVAETETELQKLDRLFIYYDVRYQIKCLSQSAIDRGAPDDSICRDARIDLAYAQELLGRSDVDVSLSERDLYLMALRVRWPEMRYQTRCIEAEEPHATCPALEEGLQKIHYFID